MRMGPHHALGHDPDAIAGASVDRGVVRRVWVFAGPYHRMLVGFLATIVVAALLALVPPLLIRSIIDDAIPNQDRGQVSLLAALMVGAAILSALLSLRRTAVVLARSARG